MYPIVHSHLHDNGFAAKDLKKNITDERGYELFNSDNTAQNKTRYICMINLNIWYSFIKFKKTLPFCRSNFIHMHYSLISL